MSNLDDQLKTLNLQFSMLTLLLKPIPYVCLFDLSAHVEVIADVSGKSRNIIMADLLRLGVAYFLIT